MVCPNGSLARVGEVGSGAHIPAYIKTNLDPDVLDKLDVPAKQYIQQTANYISECLVIILALMFDTSEADIGHSAAHSSSANNTADDTTEKEDFYFPSVPHLCADLSSTDVASWSRVRADSRLAHMVMALAAFGFNMGAKELYFRPYQAYGTEDGDSYMEFEKAAKKHQLDTDCTDSQMAKQMRLIASQSDPTGQESADFLYPLAAVWLIAEPARYPLALLSGLALIDLMESGAALTDLHLESGEAFNWYTWSCALIHPYKHINDKLSTGSSESLSFLSPSSRVKDMYGNVVKVDEFGGMHPMAHSGSVKDCQNELREGHQLSIARQKAGSLLIDWLYRFLVRHIPAEGIVGHPAESGSTPSLYKVTSSVQTVQESPLNKAPSYDRITELEARLFKRKTKEQKYSKSPFNKSAEPHARIQKTNRIMELLEDMLLHRLGSPMNPLLDTRQVLRSFCSRHAEHLFHPDPAEGPRAKRFSGKVDE